MNLESEGHRGPGSGRKKSSSKKSKSSQRSRSKYSVSPKRFKDRPVSPKRFKDREQQSPKLIGARKLFSNFKSKAINFEALQEAMEFRQNCFRKIKDETVYEVNDVTSSAQGYVYKTCGHVVSNCYQCDDPLAIKIFIRRSFLSPEPLQEARILEQLSDAFSKDAEFGTMYLKHIIRYVDYIQETRENPSILITQLVEFSPGRALNFKEFLRSGNCTVDILESILIQILLTLEYAYQRVPGFVHFDLLPQQIFLRDTKKQVVLKTPSSTFKLKTTIEAVIGDFGFSLSTKYPNHQEPILKDFQLRVIGFDVFRLLTECSFLVGFDSTLHHRMKLWLMYAFKNKLSKIQDLTDEWIHKNRLKNKYFRDYGYLPETAKPYIKSSPLEFMKRIPYVNNYYSRNS